MQGFFYGLRLDGYVQKWMPTDQKAYWTIHAS